MSITVKNKANLIVPESVRRQAGIKAGDRVEFKVSSRTITIKPVEPPTYKPTKAELAAIQNGEAEIARGEFVTLTDFLHDMDSPGRKGGAKAARKISR
jgi:AbrB family looped-hinge helix DNA binding protein